MLKIDKKTFIELRTLALNLSDSGNFLESKKLYECLIKSNPLDLGLKRVASWNLRKMKDYDSAFKMLEECLDGYCEEHHIWYDMAMVYENKIDNLYGSKDAIQIATSPTHHLEENVVTYIELAIKCLENAHKTCPTSWGITKKIEKYYAFIGNYSKATEYHNLTETIFLARKSNQNNSI